ncbi:MAG: CDP-diacylglycerol--glycerol-3-phosphate 3-phosphatidyltransferase [Clostridia bacterium]|nr:CDP-diacylglycerol--glycerol-3-phosphate 3-phosphatidyltransferase [Clostridia bacterium]
MNLPNKLTLLRVILVPVFVVMYIKQMFIPAFIVFIVASFTDMLDGKIARKYNLITNFGKIMDPLADKILVYSAFCLFIEDGTMPAWILIVILLREFTVAGMRTVAASEGIVIAAGITGKIKTVLQMIAVPLLIISSMHNVLYILSQVFLWASLVMTIVSGVEYVVKNKSVFA